jgi:uncharacterized damage-inducible protein DinB
MRNAGERISMSLKYHFELLSTYNQWMNLKIYEAAGRLSAEELSEDRGAFFGSILGTLNHIVVGDRIWLKRFATHPSCGDSLGQVAALPNPAGLDQILFEDLGELFSHRKWLDTQILGWVPTLSDADLDYALPYQNTKGVSSTRRFSYLVLHFFNHQTHHRGQISTMLHQAGEDVGATDLLALIPEESHT